jgi:hypothetical protein
MAASILEPGEQQGEVGGGDRLPRTTFGRHHHHHLAFAPLGGGGGDRRSGAPLEEVVGELLDGRLDLLLGEGSFDDVLDPGPHGRLEHPRGDGFRHRHDDQGRVLVAELAHRVDRLLGGKRRPHQDHPQHPAVHGGDGLGNRTGGGEPPIEEALGLVDERRLLVDYQQIVF